MRRLFIQLRLFVLSRKNYGEPRGKPYAYQQAAILLVSQGFTYMLNSPQSPEVRGTEMTLLKPEETLHVYLRRHFERVSKGMERQFAEKRDTPELAVADPYPTAGS